MIWNAEMKRKWIWKLRKWEWNRWCRKTTKTRSIKCVSSVKWSDKKSKRRYTLARRRKQSNWNTCRHKIDKERISSMIKSHRRIRKRIIWSNSRKELPKWREMSSWGANRWKLRLNLTSASLRKKLLLGKKSRRLCRWRCWRWNLSKNFKILRPFKNKLIAS